MTMAGLSLTLDHIQSHNGTTPRKTVYPQRYCSTIAFCAARREEDGDIRCCLLSTLLLTTKFFPSHQTTSTGVLEVYFEIPIDEVAAHTRAKEYGYHSSSIWKHEVCQKAFGRKKRQYTLDSFGLSFYPSEPTNYLRTTTGYAKRHPTISSSGTDPEHYRTSPPHEE
jgi:hypothetical protein